MSFKVQILIFKIQTFVPHIKINYLSSKTGLTLVHKDSMVHSRANSKTSRKRTHKTEIPHDIDTLVVEATDVTKLEDIERKSACIIKHIINSDNSSKHEIIESYDKAKQFLKENKISISTITLNCKLNTIVLNDCFAKYVILKYDGIVSVKYGNRKDAATNRSIVVLKAKKKPSKKNFYNQVTILIKPTNNPNRNYINIKVFKNGSLQITGCKDMDDFKNVVKNLISILKKGARVRSHGKVKHVPFIESPDNIGISDIKIRMINSDFKVDYKIDRKKLDKLLKKHHGRNTRDMEIGYVDFKYTPTGGHSCVNIKYHYDEIHRPSIFVFQTGSIIITGAKTLYHIIDAYNFIQKILVKYYHQIRIVELDVKAVKAAILRFRKARAKAAQQTLEQGPTERRNLSVMRMSDC